MTWHKLGDICEFKYGSSLPASVRSGDAFPVYGSNGVVGAHLQSLTDGPTIVVGRKGSIGEVNFSNGPCWPIDTTYFIDRTATKADLRWLSYALSGLRLGELNKATGVPGLNRNDAYEKLIFVPPVDEQRRIAAILDQADELRRKRQSALNRLNQLGQAIFIEMFGDPALNPKGLAKVELGELIKVSSGIGLTAANQNGGRYPVYGGNGVNGWHDQFTVPAGTVVIGRVGVYCGAVHVTDRDAWVTDNALVVTLKRPLNRTYLATALKLANLNQYAGRSAQPLVSGSRIYPVQVLHPTLEEQDSFEARLLQAQALSVDYESASNHINRLFAALQNRAFSGEL